MHYGKAHQEGTCVFSRWPVKRKPDQFLVCDETTPDWRSDNPSKLRLARNISALFKVRTVLVLSEGSLDRVLLSLGLCRSRHTKVVLSGGCRENIH